MSRFSLCAFEGAIGALQIADTEGDPVVLYLKSNSPVSFGPGTLVEPKVAHDPAIRLDFRGLEA